MRLYHHPISSNARRAVMTGIHLGVNVDLVVVDLEKGAQRSPEFLEMNPNGRVPVLNDDGFLLWESHAIMQYLADKTPAQTIYPQAIRARADVNRWLFWSAYHFTPAVGILNWENLIKRIVGGGDPDPTATKRGDEQVSACARILDAHLADKEWIAQDTLTLADFAIAAPLMTTVIAKLPVTNYANLQAWFARVRALDAWKKTEF